MQLQATNGPDMGLDREFTAALDDRLRVSTWRAHHLLALEQCDVAIAPTPWRESQLPATYQSKIQVLHECVDTELLEPNPQRRTDIAKWTGAHRRGRRDQLRPTTEVRQKLTRSLAARGEDRHHQRDGAGALPGQAALCAIPPGAAGLSRSRLPHLSLRALLVPARSAGQKLCGGGFRYRAGQGGDPAWASGLLVYAVGKVQAVSTGMQADRASVAERLAKAAGTAGYLALLGCFTPMTLGSDIRLNVLQEVQKA